MAYELQDRAFRLLIDDRNVSYVLITLAWYADHDKNQCYPSIDTLAKRCCMNRHYVLNSIKTLERYGVIHKKRRYCTSNIYEFSKKFKMVVQKNEDISIEDFILAGEVKVPREALQLTTTGEVKVPREALQLSKLKCLEEHSNKVDITNNKEDIKQDTSYLAKVEGKTESLSREIVEAAERVLEHYNKTFNCKAKETRYFLRLLEPTSTRGAYTEQDLITVIDWIASEWNFTPRPIQFTRISRFDEYLTKATQWLNASASVNAAEVVEAYNNTFGDSLPYAELDRDLERKIHRLADCMKEKSVTAFINYFEYFNKHAPDFYFGNNNTGWRADIDFLLKPETLRKTRNFT